MFTLFELLGFIGGTMLGATYGWKWLGLIGLILGGAGGFLAGGIVGRLPLIISLNVLLRKLQAMTNEELRRHMRDNDCLTPNIVLLELDRRGEDIVEELPFVCSLLTSDDRSRRTFGWAALTSAFPDYVQKIPGYNPTASISTCRDKCKPLTDAILPTEDRSV